jgi:hypothetical protein
MATYNRIGDVKTLGTEAIAFSGGGCIGKTRRTQPASPSAYRPTSSLKEIMHIEKVCVTPLEEERRIDVGPAKSKTDATFASWLTDVGRHFATTGLDSIAYVITGGLNKDSFDFVKAHAADNAITPDVFQATIESTFQEHNLFKDWGSVTMAQIKIFEEAMLAGNHHVDISNSDYASRFLRGSVGVTLRERIDRELSPDVSATRLLFYIIRKLQAVSSTSSRQLISELQGLRLSKFSGHHVSECAQAIHNLCTKINGLGETHVPSDLPMLVVQCFDSTDVKTFDLEVTKLETDLDEDLTKHSVDDILTKLTDKFDKLVNTNRWPSLQANPKSSSVSGFAVQLANMTKELHEVRSSLGNSKSFDSGCRYCKATDHEIAECPILAQKNRGKGSRNWTKIRPADGEPETKTVTEGGVTSTAKFCSVCRRWRIDEKAHTTSEHVRRNPVTSAPAPTAAAPAPAPTATSSIVGHTLAPEGASGSARPSVSFDLYGFAFLPLELDSDNDTDSEDMPQLMIRPPNDSSDSDSDDDNESIPDLVLRDSHEASTEFLQLFFESHSSEELTDVSDDPVSSEGASIAPEGASIAPEGDVDKDTNEEAVASTTDGPIYGPLEELDSDNGANYMKITDIFYMLRALFLIVPETMILIGILVFVVLDTLWPKHHDPDPNRWWETTDSWNTLWDEVHAGFWDHPKGSAGRI